MLIDNEPNIPHSKLDLVQGKGPQEIYSKSVSINLEDIKRKSEEFRMSLWLEHLTRVTQVTVRLR